jgi:hypothetical protein
LIGIGPAALSPHHTPQSSTQNQQPAAAVAQDFACWVKLPLLHHGQLLSHPQQQQQQQVVTLGLPQCLQLQQQVLALTQ